MTEQRATYCNRDCPDTCRIVATVDDGRVVQLQGDKAHPMTRGFLCQRTNQFLHLQYGPARLTQPLMRKGGRHVPVSWEEALDRIAVELRRIVDDHGPEAVFHYRSGGTLGLLVATASDLFFERLGPVTIKRGDICSGAGEAAQVLDFGVSDSSDPDDIAHARHVLLWGKNVATSSPHSLPRLNALRRAGGRIVAIDPVAQSATLRLADRYLQPRPAGDLALALAVARRLFERGAVHPEASTYCRDLEAFRHLTLSRDDWLAVAGVSDDEAEYIADALADGPTTILVGWGMARRRNGGAIVRALDALGAITGNVGIRGAGVSYYHQRRSAFSSPVTGAAARTIPEPLFGPALLAADPPVRALWVTAGNPAAMLPDTDSVAKAIRTCEFVVVADPLFTDTARLADVVLPTPTLLESDDLLGAYGHHYLGASRPVVAPPAGVRSDLWIFQQLAERLGFGEVLAGSTRQWKDRLLGPSLREAGVDARRLVESPPLRNPDAAKVVFSGRRFATDDGRAHLMTTLPTGALPGDLPAEFPLWLLSLSTPASQSAQWSRGAPSPLPVTVHPDSAAGIHDGGRGRLVSAIGALDVEVRHDTTQRRDVAIVPKGGLPSLNACANRITAAALTDIGEGGALYDQAVRLEPAGVDSPAASH